MHGKENFGGPFTEEEVEDVKTVLRLLPLVICLSLSVSTLEMSPKVTLLNDDTSILKIKINIANSDWLFPEFVIAQSPECY